MRFFRRINLNKRKIITLGTIIVVFVMSLGYAALSQHMDIDGIAQIDRSWIIKVTGIEVSTTNEGVDTNNNYVSNTVAMNANLPTSLVLSQMIVSICTRSATLVSHTLTWINF